jgi:hypothetical protein
MDNKQLFQLRSIDWRWFIVSYCFLVLFHLAPSFLMGGSKNSFVDPFTFLLWIGIGTPIICAIIAWWSRGITILEPGLAVALYTFTLLGTLKPYWLFGRGYRSVAEQVLLLLSMFVVGCLGAAFGEWLQMRKEKKQVA